MVAKIFSFKYNKVFLLYLFYVFLVLLVFHLLNFIIPQYKGFTGEWGIGGDDLYFFDQVAGFNPVYNHEARPGSYSNLHNFSRFLKIFTWLIPYKLHHIDMLIFNILPLVFIPHFLLKVANKLFKEEKCLNLLFIVSAICPFTMMNGLIVLRDAWVAFFFIMFIWGCLEKKIILSLSVLGLIWFLRSQALPLVILLTAIILVFYYVDNNDYLKLKTEYLTQKKQKRIILILLAILILISILLSIFSFRSEFVTGFLTEDNLITKRSSVYFQIFSSPWYIRLPLGVLFFWGAPFITLKNMFVLNTFILRGVFEQLFGILFIFYIPVYFQSFFSLFHRNKLWINFGLHLAYMAGIVILSQMSIQVRHKTMIMPLFYLILYSGFINKSIIGRIIGIIVSIILLFITIYVNYSFVYHWLTVNI